MLAERGLIYLLHTSCASGLRVPGQSGLAHASPLLDADAAINLTSVVTGNGLMDADMQAESLPYFANHRGLMCGRPQARGDCAQLSSVPESAAYS